MLVLAGLILISASSPPAETEDEAKPPAAPVVRGDDRDNRKGARPSGGDEDDEMEEEGRVQPRSAIVVTGRRLDAARMAVDSALGATVYALTNDAVENRPGGETGSVSDILAQAAGVVPSGRGLAVRGSRASQVRINDVIVPEAVADPAEHLSARLAETTRLLTGTLPAQFGFAPGGVISVKTKSGLYQHGGQAELFAGSDGMLEPAAEYSGSAGGTSLFASGSFERGHSVVSDPAGLQARDSRRAFEGLGFADHVIDSQNRVSLIVGGSRERSRIGATSLGPGREGASDVYVVGSFLHSEAGFTLQTSVFGGIGSRIARFVLPTRERRTSFGTQVDGSAEGGSAHTVRFGLLAGRSTSREAVGPATSTRAGRIPVALYVQDEWRVARSLVFNPGVRTEWLRGLSSKAAIEPRASLVWSPGEDLTVHAGYARYRSAPPLGEPGGAALHDETDDYFDVGLQNKIGPLTLGLDGYWRAARDYLAERESPGSAIATPFGIARARVRGVELSATYAHGGTSAWANLAISEATGRTIVDGAGLFPPATLAAAAARPFPLAANRPLAASAGFTRRLGEFTFSADVQVSSGAVRTLDPAAPNGSRYPAQALLGLAAVYHARLGGSPADIRIDLTNLGNARQVTSDARSLEGGWTRESRRRAVTIGIEKAF